MRADEREKDWKGRCFNESSSFPDPCSVPRYVQYTGAAWAQPGSGSGRDGVGWAWACVGSAAGSGRVGV